MSGVVGHLLTVGDSAIIKFQQDGDDDSGEHVDVGEIVRGNAITCANFRYARVAHT